MNFLFPYMARWKAVNWTRYHWIFTCLAKTGHNIHVIQSPAFDSIETNFQEIEAEIPGNLHLHDIDINPFIWNRNYPLNKLVKKGYYSIKSIGKVKEIIKKHKIDVLFLYNIPQYPLMKINSCIKIFDFADDYIEMLKHELGKLGNSVIYRIGQSILDKMVEKSDLTLVISKVLADSIHAGDNKKIEIIPNGVDFDNLEYGCGKDIREKYKKPIIGFIGSFEYFIDFDIILDTSAILKDYTFLLVGSGRNFKEVKDQVEDRSLKNVILTGGVPHAEVMKYIDAMDICLNIFKKIPISHGASPIKLFEYLSMKKPVISTRLDEMKNIDEDFLFYADTVKELEDKIKEIIANRDLSERYVEKGYNTVKRKYDWGHIVDNLLDIINLL